MRLRRRVRILSLSRGAGHVFRAIMESICYGTEHIFQSMRGNGFEPKEVAAGVCPNVQEAEEVAHVESGMKPEAAGYEYYVETYSPDARLEARRRGARCGWRTGQQCSEKGDLMLAAVFNGPGEIEIKELETPGIGPDEVLVKVEANTVCGTDVRILRGEKTKGISRPGVLGHELAGRVAEVGGDVGSYEAGMRVVVSPGIPCGRCYPCKHDMENMCSELRVIGYDVLGGLSEFVRVPAAAVRAGNIFIARGDLPAEHLALAEPLACCVNGHRRSRTDVDDAVLVMGAGPIGLFHVQLARLAGARTVIVSEPSEERRQMAEELGADVTVDPTSEDLPEVVGETAGGLGVDVAVICIGIPALVNDALRLTRPGGRVNVFAGLAGKGWAEVEANLIHYKELEVTGTSNSRRRDFEAALRLIETGRIDVEPMVTHRYPLESAVEAIEMSASGQGIKIAVIP